MAKKFSVQNPATTKKSLYAQFGFYLHIDQPSTATLDNTNSSVLQICFRNAQTVSKQLFDS